MAEAVQTQDDLVMCGALKPHNGDTPYYIMVDNYFQRGRVSLKSLTSLVFRGFEQKNMSTACINCPAKEFCLAVEPKESDLGVRREIDPLRAQGSAIKAIMFQHLLVVLDKTFRASDRTNSTLDDHILDQQRRYSLQMARRNENRSKKR